jgi:tripartite-type tricarboxylate transporter receptor subunit TctC
MLMKMIRNQVATWLGGLVCACLPMAAFGQAYPAKPIRLIVPFAAGGGSDVVARMIGAELTKAWGQPIVVENRAGAGGIIGAEHVLRSPPDGYTMLLVEVGGLTIRSLLNKVPFDLLKDFAGVAVVAYGPNVLITSPALPANSVSELIALAKARPGQLNFALPGVGSVAHLAGVELEQTTGVKFNYVSYKGGGPAMLDVLSGQVDFSVNGVLATLPHIKSGKLRALAVATKEPHPALPGVPTISATIPGHESGSRQAVLASAAVPRDIIAKWNAEIARINALPESRERLAALGALPEFHSPAEFQSLIAADHRRWARIIEKGQIKGE